MTITKQYLATATVAFFMAFGLAYVAPTVDAVSQPQPSAEALMQAKQAAADAEAKKVADAYAYMSDAERMRGVVYEP